MGLFSKKPTTYIGYDNGIPTVKTVEKKASVVGRGVAGGIIAGPAGAVVGALSAIDKNNKNNK